MGERPHPHPDYEWGCPDCDSTDIAVLARNPKARYQQPPGFCYDCGIRFTEPDEVLVS